MRDKELFSIHSVLKGSHKTFSIMSTFEQAIYLNMQYKDTNKDIRKKELTFF